MMMKMMTKPYKYADDLDDDDIDDKNDNYTVAGAGPLVMAPWSRLHPLPGASCRLLGRPFCRVGRDPPAATHPTEREQEQERELESAGPQPLTLTIDAMFDSVTAMTARIGQT